MEKPFRKVLLGIIALCLIALIALVTEQSSIIKGEDGLIAKARKEIRNLAEVETIEMTIAGKSTVDDRQLFWIITGNEYQMHRYYPLEVIELEEDKYRFVHLHNLSVQRAQDVYFEYFGNGYSFVVNNPKCKGIVINGTTVPVSEIPFVYYYPFIPNEYYFVDADGNELY